MRAQASSGSNQDSMNLQELFARASNNNQAGDDETADLNLDDLQSQGWTQMGEGQAEGDMTAEGNMTSEGDMTAEGDMDGEATVEGGEWSANMQGAQTQWMQGGTTTSQGTVVSVSKPVYAQRLISQPIIKRQIIQQPVIRRRIMKKNLIRSVQNMSPTVRNRSENRSVNVTVPAREINNLTVVQPTVHTNNVDVKFNKLPQRTMTRPVIVEPVKSRAESRSRTVTVPGTQNIHHTIIRPSVHTIRHNVSFQKAADRNVNHRPVTRPMRYTRRERTQVVNAPGNEVHNYTTHKPMVRTENVKVQFNKQPEQVTNKPEIVENVQRRTRKRVQNAQIPAEKTIIQPIVQNIVRDREMHHIHKPIFKRVEVVRTVKVPTNIIQKVPVVKRVPVPVRTKGRVQVWKGKEYWDTRYQGKATGPRVTGGASLMTTSTAGQAQWNAAASAQQSEWSAETAQADADAAQADADNAQDDADLAAEGADDAWASQGDASNAGSDMGEWSEWTADVAGDASAQAEDAAEWSNDSAAQEGDAQASEGDAADWANVAWDSAAEESSDSSDSQSSQGQGWSFGGNWSNAAAPLNLSDLGLAQAGFQQLNLGGAGAVMIGRN